jgi:hypothetical protein
VTAPQSQSSTSLVESLERESQDSAASPNKRNGDEVKTNDSQLTKRQRKNQHQDTTIFYGQCSPALTVSQSSEVNELVNLTHAIFIMKQTVQ